MKRPSFSTQLVMLWALVAALCATLVGRLDHREFRRESAGREREGRRRVGLRSGRVALQRVFRVARRRARPELMHAILDIVLPCPDMEGGFWMPGAAPAANGFLAYSFPTYRQRRQTRRTGSGNAADPPHARAAATRAATANVVEGAQDAVIAAACPVRGGSGLYVWMLTRARPPLGRHGELLATGLAAVLAVILAIAAALAVALRRWKRNLARIESGLGPTVASIICRTSAADLDRVIDAFNERARRADRLQQQADELRTRLAQAERFGMLGKLAAQVAHEIRNPMGAMRLKAENALAGDGRRQQDALRVILAQIERIDAQLSSLLALTQPVRPQATRVDVDAWLAQVVDAHRELAQRQAIDLTLSLAGRANGWHGRRIVLLSIPTRCGGRSTTCCSTRCTTRATAARSRSPPSAHVRRARLAVPHRVEQRPRRAGRAARADFRAVRDGPLGGHGPWSGRRARSGGGARRARAPRRGAAFVIEIPWQTSS